MEKNNYSSIKAVFDFNVFSDECDEFNRLVSLYSGGALVTVTAEELEAIEDCFRKLDGHACAFEALPFEFRCKVQDAAMAAYAESGCMDPDSDEYYYDYYFDSVLPPVLVHEVEKVLNYKGMTVEYSVSADGKVHKDEVCISMSVDDFYRFAAVQGEYHDGYSDFDWLKERDRDVYDRVFELVNECGEKWWMAHGGRDIQPVVMTDCPIELWRYINGEAA